MNPAKLVGIGLVIFVLVIAASQSTYVVEPGFRGVEVTLGKVDPQFKPQGFGSKTPFITHIVSIPVRQLTNAISTECYSSDLQQVSVALRVLYRIPESSVVRIYSEYSGDPFDSLIAPRVQEALKEVTALQSAEQIVKKREDVKVKSLAAAHPFGSALTVHEPSGERLQGQFDGLEPDGALRLRLADGACRVIHAGDVMLGGSA